MNDISDTKSSDFVFPTELVEQIYDISGGAENFKGVVVCVCSPKGTPQIYTRFDSVVTSLGIKKALEQWLSNEDESLNQQDGTD
jgi:hypothetical protein